MSEPRPGPLLITARLAGPLAGDPPRLDALLESVLSLYHPKAAPGYKIDRAGPAPPQASVPIPILRRTVTGDDGRAWQVACCSDPILPVPDAETVEHYCKRIGVENAGLMDPAARVVVATGNSWTKSYRLPLRIRRVAEVRWFAFGDRRTVWEVLRRVHFLGKKISYGYGRVASWEVAEVDEDLTWFAPTGHGPLLMATLPDGPHLPGGLIGARRDFGACVPPLWHPSRYCDIIRPA